MKQGHWRHPQPARSLSKKRKSTKSTIPDTEVHSAFVTHLSKSPVSNSTEASALDIDSNQVSTTFNFSSRESPSIRLFSSSVPSPSQLESVQNKSVPPVKSTSNLSSNPTSETNDSFPSLGVRPWIINQLSELQMRAPTPVQKHCIPPILEGRNCVACAKTGSGKTAAFAVPIVQRFAEDPYGVFALVLTPTRELAFQISEAFVLLGRPSCAVGLQVTVLVGGRDMVEQGRQLESRPHVLVATPGRLADHIRSGTKLYLSRIRFLVLDEADRLLEDDFGEDLATIFAPGLLPAARQTLLFSATFSDPLRELLNVTLKEPFAYFETAPSSTVTVSSLEQRYLLAPADVKDAYVVHVLREYLAAEEHKRSSVLLFCSTRKYAQLLAMVLRRFGLESASLHAALKQRERLRVLQRFKSLQTRILIATDLASRGLDIPTVDLVLNHNVPTRPKDYVHRVGRTARAESKLVEHSVDETEVSRIVTEVAVARRLAEMELDAVDFDELSTSHAITAGKRPHPAESQAAKRTSNSAYKRQRPSKSNSTTTD